MVPTAGADELEQASCTARFEEDGRPPDAAQAGIVFVQDDGLVVETGLSPPFPIRFRDLVRHELLDTALVLHVEGGRVVLERLARALQPLRRTLIARRRAHFLRALLLTEEGESRQADEVQEETGSFRRAGGAAEPCAVRLQPSSVAVLPDGSRPFLVPYGEVAGVSFDETSWSVRLQVTTGGEQALELLGFGKRTSALRTGLESRMAGLQERNARALAALAPGAGPFALRRLAAVVRDGVPASREAVEAAAPGAWAEIWTRAVATARRPYAQALLDRAQGLWIVLKELIRPDAVAQTAESRQADGGDGEAFEAEEAPALAPELEGRHVMYVFAVGPGLIVELPTAADSATYVFRRAGETETAVRDLCRALGAVQLRREPIYLPAQALEVGEKACYRDALALLPGLAALRAALLGRAPHRSVASWNRAIEESLSRA